MAMSPYVYIDITDYWRVSEESVCLPSLRFVVFVDGGQVVTNSSKPWANACVSRTVDHEEHLSWRGRTNTDISISHEQLWSEGERCSRRWIELRMICTGHERKKEREREEHEDFWLSVCMLIVFFVRSDAPYSRLSLSLCVFTSISARLVRHVRLGDEENKRRKKQFSLPKINRH